MTTSLDLLHTAHVPPGAGPFPTILTLHGWGASAHDLLGLAPALPDGLQVICPQGAVSVPIAPGYAGHGWFPLVPGQPPDLVGFKKGAEQLRGFVDGVGDRFRIDPARFVTLGFSQGGAMGYDLTLRQPERFVGLIALSTWLAERLDEELPQLEAHRGFPMLVIHGTQDAVLPIEKARTSRRLLEARGVDVEYHELPMAHEINPEALRLIVDWLDRRLPS
ncbi:MAG: alpha/beta hydrolase [Acidobacteriota bacterium]